MRPITVQKRGEIIAAHNQTASLRKTAAACGVSKRTAQRWVQRYKNTGDVLRKAGSGRRPALSAAAAARAVELLTAEPGASTSHAAQQLQQEGLTGSTAHRTTVARAAKQAARQQQQPIHCVSGLPAKRLTVKNKKQRLAFAQANKRRQWASVIFTDRKKFLFSHPGVSVQHRQWVKKGQRRTAARVNHPQAVNVYMGICKWGCTPLKFVAGTSKHSSPYTTKQGKPAKNITSQEYTVVVGKGFLPEGSKLFAAQGISKWTLQQDNDPAHKVAAGVVAAYSRGNTAQVELLPNWPPNSPDLNPIENLWGILAEAVGKQQCCSFEEFREAVEKQCSGVSHNTLAKLVDSMQKRIDQVIQKQGDMTEY
jgi:transposase